MEMISNTWPGINHLKPCQIILKLLCSTPPATYVFLMQFYFGYSNLLIEVFHAKSSGIGSPPLGGCFQLILDSLFQEPSPRIKLWCKKWSLSLLVINSCWHDVQQEYWAYLRPLTPLQLLHFYDFSSRSNIIYIMQLILYISMHLLSAFVEIRALWYRPLLSRVSTKRCTSVSRWTGYFGYSKCKSYGWYP